MAKREQFDLELDKRANRDDDPRVDDPFDITLPPYMEEDENGEEYEVTEGKTITVNPPRVTRFILLQAQYESSADALELASSATALIYSCLDTEGRSYIRRRFNDDDDPFGLSALNDMIELMMETWSTRPTKSASGSSSSPAKRGQGSTPKQRDTDGTTSENSTSDDS